MDIRSAVRPCIHEPPFPRVSAVAMETEVHIPLEASVPRVSGTHTDAAPHRRTATATHAGAMQRRLT
ncbi:hypothetical protein AAFF_G00092890 [Aldrovandia affinis]|uniref:Uncharacterized protein n=1 Tax=Aldrovandia affinis TaxID=143900 RepID=A0AAD7WY67_9TELE|nr:hypothetical protein AAFF_G00092890 [Aldrovandia affinis]